jgi:PEP-CTERM motif
MKRMGTFALALGVLGLGASAHAVPITGEIEFAGSLDTSPLDATLLGATGLHFVTARVNNAGPGTPSGSYLGVPDLTAVTMTDFQFNPFVSPGVLWDFTTGGIHYWFTLADAVVSQFQFDIDPGPGVNMIAFLSLAGNGMAHIDGFDPTPGVFSLSTQGGSSDRSTFFFSAQTNVPAAAVTEAAVPEPGMLVLVGAGMAGLALRRRLRSC